MNDVTRRAYVDTGCYPEPGGITVIDTHQPRVIERLNMGDSVGDLAVNPVTNRIYAKQDGDPGHVSVVDGETNQVVDRIMVGASQGKGIGLNSNTDRIYVSNYADHTVSVIDGAAGTVIATIDLIPGQGSFPTDIAVNSKTNRIYVECFALTDEIPYVCVIDGDANSVVARIRVPTIESNFAIDEERNFVYAASYFLDEVLRIDGATNEIVDTVKTIGSANEVSYNPHTDRIYISSGGPPGNELAGRLLTVDGATFKQVNETVIGGILLGIGIYSAAYRLFVVENFGNQVVVLTEDAVAPVSSMTTTTGSILSKGQMITGSVTDDLSGVDKVRVAFSPSYPFGTSYVDASVVCTPDRRACTWQAPAPTTSGTYLVQVQGIDRAGSTEVAGPSTKSPAGPYASVVVL